MEYKRSFWIASSVLPADMFQEVAYIIGEPGAKKVDAACAVYLANKENEGERPGKKQDIDDVELIRDMLPELIRALSNLSAMAEIAPRLQEMRYIECKDVPLEIITPDMTDIINKLKYIYQAAERSPLKKKVGRGGYRRKDSPGYILVSAIKKICDDCFDRGVKRAISYGATTPSDPVSKILAIVQGVTGEPYTGLWKRISSKQLDTHMDI